MSACTGLIRWLECITIFRVHKSNFLAETSLGANNLTPTLIDGVAPHYLACLGLVYLPVNFLYFLSAFMLRHRLPHGRCNTSSLVIVHSPVLPRMRSNLLNVFNLGNVEGPVLREEASLPRRIANSKDLVDRCFRLAVGCSAGKSKPFFHFHVAS